MKQFKFLFLTTTLIFSSLLFAAGAGGGGGGGSKEDAAEGPFVLGANQCSFSFQSVLLSNLFVRNPEDFSPENFDQTGFAAIPVTERKALDSFRERGVDFLVDSVKGLLLESSSSKKIADLLGARYGDVDSKIECVNQTYRRQAPRNDFESQPVSRPHQDFLAVTWDKFLENPRVATYEFEQEMLKAGLYSRSESRDSAGGTLIISDVSNIWWSTNSGYVNKVKQPLGFAKVPSELQEEAFVAKTPRGRGTPQFLNCNMLNKLQWESAFLRGSELTQDEENQGFHFWLFRNSGVSSPQVVHTALTYHITPSQKQEADPRESTEARLIHRFDINLQGEVDEGLIKILKKQQLNSKKDRFIEFEDVEKKYILASIENESTRGKALFYFYNNVKLYGFSAQTWRLLECLYYGDESHETLLEVLKILVRKSTDDSILKDDLQTALYIPAPGRDTSLVYDLFKYSNKADEMKELLTPLLLKH